MMFIETRISWLRLRKAVWGLVEATARCELLKVHMDSMRLQRRLREQEDDQP